MHKTFSYLFIATLVISCCPQTKENAIDLNTIDYITVGLMMDTVKPPYVIDLVKNNKRLVFIGCDHNNDSTHAQYKILKQYFNDVRPQLALNEGGQISDSIHFKSGGQAIAEKGETGYLKYLCDEAGIHMMDGDINDSLEFSITLRKYPKDQLLLYYLMERLVIPYLYGAYGDRPFEELYDKAIERWFIMRNFPVPDQQKTLDGFKKLYQQYTGNPFELKITSDIEKFDYINGGGCQFCAIGRTSKMVRDSILLQKIDKSLGLNDRVIVTFGHGHALAVEPALKQIMSKF